MLAQQNVNRLQELESFKRVVAPFHGVRPAVYERYVQPYEIYHPKGALRFLVDAEWAPFALIVCTIGVYIIFLLVSAPATESAGCGPNAWRGEHAGAVARDRYRGNSRTQPRV